MRVLTLLVFAFCFTDVGRVRLGLGDWPFPGCGVGGWGLRAVSRVEGLVPARLTFRRLSC